MCEFDNLSSLSLFIVVLVYGILDRTLEILLMSGETKLDNLLQSMQPILCEGEDVFCSISHQDNSYCELDPVCLFRENEGLMILYEFSN